MADIESRNRIPIWVWVVIAVIIAAVVFYVATRPPPAPERGDVFTNEMLVDDPMATQPGAPVQPQPGIQTQPVDPTAPGQDE
jgi:hypothetical protein